jgi:hypothetical protein
MAYIEIPEKLLFKILGAHGRYLSKHQAWRTVTINDSIERLIESGIEKEEED